MAIETSKELHRAAARADDSVKRILDALEAPTSIQSSRFAPSRARYHTMLIITLVGRRFLNRRRFYLAEIGSLVSPSPPSAIMPAPVHVSPFSAPAALERPL